MARSKSTGSSAKSVKSVAARTPKAKASSKAVSKPSDKPSKKASSGARPAVVVKVKQIPAKVPSKSGAKTTTKVAAKSRPQKASPQLLVTPDESVPDIDVFDEAIDDLDLGSENVEAEATENAVAIDASTTSIGRIASLSNPMPASRAPQHREPVAVSPIATMPTPRALPETLAERYELVKSRIAGAAKRSGRRAEDILLVAVTKYATPEQVRELLALGHRDLGENRVQHLLQQAAMVEEYQSRLKALPATRKAAADAAATLFDSVPGKPGIPDPAATTARWHMIGHLQRNKAKKIVELVRLTHSVDSLRVAEELQTLALKKDRVIDVLIQVNCSGEDQKFGCPIPATIPLAEQIGSMINVRVRGLMTMAAYSENPEDSRHCFARCRELFEELKGSGVVEGPVNILSMGMTGDFEVAIEEGANCVRIGSAIFGEPPVSSGDEAESDEE